jgi:hypothetical protein
MTTQLHEHVAVDCNDPITMTRSKNVQFAPNVTAGQSRPSNGYQQPCARVKLPFSNTAISCADCDL